MLLFDSLRDIGHDVAMRSCNGGRQSMGSKRILSGLILGTALAFSAWGANEKPVILDVRTPQEFNQIHLDGATNIDFLNPDFRTRVEKLDRNKSYVVYCHSGNRAGKAEKLMKSMGFKDVKNVGGVKDASKTLKVACGDKPEC